jgi:hypothetical protein
MTSEDIGYILGAALIPGLLVWWGLRLRNRKSNLWPVPLAFGALVLLIGIPNVIDRFRSSGTEPIEPVVHLTPEAAFAPIPGFEFVRDPESEAAGEEALLERGDEEIIDAAFRDVEGPNGPIASVVAFTVEQRALETGFIQGFADGLASEAGGTPAPSLIGGESVMIVATEDPAVRWIVWRRSGTDLVVAIVSPSESDATDVAEAMIAAQPRTESPL